MPPDDIAASDVPHCVEDPPLLSLCSPELEPLFWRPSRMGAPSAWWGHVPFAHWLIRVARPRMLVELGTHARVSYCAFCEAVLRDKPDTRCYAVDTWKGDANSGYYGEEVFAELRQFHNSRYSGFSELLRIDFDGALAYFTDNSIDLLHLNGLHTYETVRHDFESWKPKLSRRAVVLFHDTNVRGTDFGVWRLWEELQGEFPSFEFLHAHGLGVLAVGPEPPPAVAALCAMRHPGSVNALRERFAILGERGAAEARKRLAGEAFANRDKQLSELGAALAAHDVQLNEAGAALADCEARLRTALDTVTAERRLRKRAAERAVEARRALRTAHLDAAAEAKRLQGKIAEAEAERDRILNSSLWILTGPLRGIAGRVSPRLKRPLKLVLRVSWLTATGRLPQRIRERRQPSENRRLLLDSGLFHSEWYAARYPDVAAAGVDPVLHFLLYGADEGRDPGPDFCTRAYLARYRDVMQSGVNPLIHYLLYGRAEGRLISSASAVPAVAFAGGPAVSTF
jgi:hypothetical protein